MRYIRRELNMLSTPTHTPGGLGDYMGSSGWSSTSSPSHTEACAGPSPSSLPVAEVTSSRQSVDHSFSLSASLPQSRRHASPSLHQSTSGLEGFDTNTAQSVSNHTTLPSGNGVMRPVEPVVRNGNEQLSDGAHSMNALIATDDNQHDEDLAGAASNINTLEEEPSDVAPLIANGMTCFIEIIAPDQINHRFKMLIDSGDAQQNLVSTDVLDALRLPHEFRKRSRLRQGLRRILARLFPNSKRATAVRNMKKTRNGDRSVFRGQDGSTVPISWYGHNSKDLNRRQVFFQPKRYHTTHLIVDAKHSTFDVVLCWDEIHLLGLDQRVINILPKPPTPEPDSNGEKYEGYERQRAAKKAERETEKKAERETEEARRRANGQS